jgi:hypothetical protein
MVLGLVSFIGAHFEEPSTAKMISFQSSGPWAKALRRLTPSGSSEFIAISLGHAAQVLSLTKIRACMNPLRQSSASA